MSPLSVALAVALGACVVALLVVGARLRQARTEVEALRDELARSQRGLTRQAAGLAFRTVVGTAVRVREQGVGGFLTSSIEELTGIALANRSEIVEVAGPDGTVTVLFSDIEDSTALNEKLGDADWVKLLEAHDRLVRHHVDRHDGHIVKSQGDGFMIVFGDPAGAVQAALAIQDSLSAGRGRHLRRTPIRVRMGLHCGPTIERDGDYFGRNVALAARVAAHATGGEIFVSEEVHAQLGTGEGLRFAEAEEVALKGFPGTHPLRAVTAA